MKYVFVNIRKNGNKLIPVEISKNISDRVVDLLFYKNHYDLTNKLPVFSRKQDSKYICKQFLRSDSKQNVLMKHKHQCNQQEITIIKTSKASHLCFQKYFHNNSLQFMV